MTEFEAATVAYQQAALALQQQQFWAAVAIPLVAGLVGLGQIFVVLRGIRVMDSANQERARQVEVQIEAQRRQAEAQRAEADQRHAEAMEALRQQGESLQVLVKGMEQQGESLRAAVKSMEAVIERTAPRQ